MKTYTINGALFTNMMRLGAARLNNFREEVNGLNVFPIPDGDTGDNMYMTILSGCEQITDDKNINLGKCAADVSRGMLLGARGNSGVILSRIFAGIAKGLEGIGNAGLPYFHNAMQYGVQESYKAVSNPVEGTMLTVFKDGVNKAGESSSSSFEEYFNALCNELDASLERTPSLLDVLMKAGVVDSGGAGIVCIFKGMRDAVCGVRASAPESAKESSSKVDFNAFTEDSELEFGYCTEFLLRLQRSKVDLDNFDEKVISDYLTSVGESVVFFREGSIIKAHVHTRRPGDILNRCQQWGEYLTIKIENMTLQHHENHMEDKTLKGPRKRTAVVSVASGEGLVRTFKDTGADIVIEGGQTMNPSAADFINAFRTLNAETVYVLPNNSNIILTAGQAAGMYKDSEIVVIPTKSIGEGYCVLGSLDLSGTRDDVLRQAAEAMESISTAMVSVSIRTTEDTREGEYIGFTKGNILCSTPDRKQTCLDLCGKMDADGKDVILIFKGCGVGEDESAELCDALQERYPMAEVIMNDGGQPVFDYIFIFE